MTIQLSASPATIKTFIRQLRPALKSLLADVYTHLEHLEANKSALPAFQSWQSIQPHPLHNPCEEFCLQTAFIHFAHLFILRACEEYGLTWQTPHCANTISIKYSQEACCSSHLPNQTGFAHLFAWYTPHSSLLSMLSNILSHYSFKNLSSDILGSIYNEGFIDTKNRARTGQFYTPAYLVNYMLDSLAIPSYFQDGYKNYLDFLTQSIGDLSCGSGSFLVAVSARKRAILEHSSTDITSSEALSILTSTIIGFDLNPFACYLARLNLLLQCLPFVCNESEAMGCFERLPIYCIDVLTTPDKQLPGIPEAGFDCLVGNPPYVSAHESFNNLAYRETIAKSGWYSLLHQKWDLFVPFFERNLQLLRPLTGRLSLIVSSGIETEGYADRLRSTLSTDYRLLQIDFFPGLRLFPSAAIESTIISLENCSPVPQHQPLRRRHLRTDCMHYETLTSLPQKHYDQLFRWRYNSTLNTHLMANTLPLCALVYIGTGIEAQSSEFHDTLQDGERKKRFTLHDVFLMPDKVMQRPADYPDNGVLGNDIDCYHLRRIRYVAYEKYLPDMRAPRYIALFRTPEKLLLGETSGGYYDTEGLFANHSVQVVVPWHTLETADVLQERGIQRVVRKSMQISGRTDLSTLSRDFDLRYLLAIINSRFIRHYLLTNLHEGTRKNRIYPDVWKRLPIKIIPLEKQMEIARLVEEVQEQYKMMNDLPASEAKSQHDYIDILIRKVDRDIEQIYTEDAY
ncbi:MAG TPA: N-6 DNA methylase [Ktedonobacteraceae bacterium]|jgi:hypothetical protein|nr:N-6 DNA methylase [Ktedonobacteraceae bacterium]